MAATKPQMVPDPEPDSEPDSERRLSSRRKTSGRRTDDRLASEFSAIIPCTACRVAWAALSSAELQGGQSVATYVCPRCGHQEERSGPG
jgi:hypothetical protein